MKTLKDWQALLQKIEDTTSFTERSSSRWFMRAPANIVDIKRTEERISHVLPQEFKNFLLCTNGCGAINTYIWEMLSVSEVDLCLRKTPEFFTGFIDLQEKTISDSAYATYGAGQLPETFRSEYIEHAVQISAIGDSAAVILNPATRQDNGEWEAWLIATWFPGAIRYRSFWDLMSAQLIN